MVNWDFLTPLLEAVVLGLVISLVGRRIAARTGRRAGTIRAQMFLLAVFGGAIGYYVGLGTFKGEPSNSMILSFCFAGALVMLGIYSVKWLVFGEQSTRRNDASQAIAARPKESRTRVASQNDIFVSYATSNRSIAEELAIALQSQGWTVWWDRSIPPGTDFENVIEAQLRAARCVVVLWSKASVGSRWVKAEAEEAAQRQILIPALIDDVSIPLGFRQIQAANLLDWHGSSPHTGFDSLVRSIADVLETRTRPTELQAT